MLLSWIILAVALIFYVIVIAGALSLMLQSLYEPPFAPTFNPQVLRFLDKILDEHPEITFFCEPGCGVANVAKYIKRQHPDLEVWGVERNWFVFSFAWIWNRLTPKKYRINLVRQDFAKFDQSKIQGGRSGLVYSYLLPDFLTRMYELGKFRGCLIASLDFQIQGLTPDITEQLHAAKIQYKMYTYDHLSSSGVGV